MGCLSSFPRVNSEQEMRTKSEPELATCLYRLMDCELNSSFLHRFCLIPVFVMCCLFSIKVFGNKYN